MRKFLHHLQAFLRNTNVIAFTRKGHLIRYKSTTLQP